MIVFASNIFGILSISQVKILHGHINYPNVEEWVWLKLLENGKLYGLSTCPPPTSNIFFRLCIVLLDVYHIVVGSWETGIKWAELLDRRSKWVALFLWTCIINVVIWWSSIVIYCTIVSFWQYIRLVFACTPFATMWWAINGLFWMANYKQRRME